jgi:hypothetical protein
MTVCELRRGDLMLLDYRVLHAGLPNGSVQARPIIYMVYSRPWFFDYNNHVSRVPLDMPIEHYNELPAAIRPLLVRAFSYAVRARWHEIDGPPPVRMTEPPRPPVVSRPVSSANVGRNDPCPCGSGKKFKHCHGKVA